MTGWTPSTDGGEIIRGQPEPSSPSPFPVQPGIRHHANPQTCPVESCPYLPAPCPFLPLCHARVSPYVMPAPHVSCPPPMCHARPRVSCPPPVCHARLRVSYPPPMCHARPRVSCPPPGVMPASRVSCPPPVCHACLPCVMPASHLSFPRKRESRVFSPSATCR